MPDATVTESPTAVPDDALYEVIDGRVVEKPAMGAHEVLVAALLIRSLNASGVVRRLGLVVSEMLFKLDPAGDRKRRPDVAFISYARWSRNPPVPGEEFWETAPDLAVEVVSRTNSAADVVKKLGEYFRAGVRSVWVIYPAQRLVYAYRSPTDVRVLGPGDDLDGEPVLPGLRVPVRELFGDEPAPPAEGA